MNKINKEMCYTVSDIEQVHDNILYNTRKDLYHRRDKNLIKALDDVGIGITASLLPSLGVKL